MLLVTEGRCSLNRFPRKSRVSWVVRWDRLRLVRTGRSRGSGPMPGFCGKSRFIRSRTRLAGARSDRTMTGQLLGGKCVAIASALAPAASRNVSPSRSRTSRSACLSIACAAPVRNPVTERQSGSPVTVSTHTLPSTAVLTVRVLVLPPCQSAHVASPAVREVWATPTEDFYTDHRRLGHRCLPGCCSVRQPMPPTTVLARRPHMLGLHWTTASRDAPVVRSHKIELALANASANNSLGRWETSAEPEGY